MKSRVNEPNNKRKNKLIFENFMGNLGTILITFFSYILKIMVLTVKTPFFIIFYIKNFFAVLVGSIVLYTIGFVAYYSLLTNISPADAKFAPPDELFYPIMISIAILALFATIGQFTKD